MQFVHFAHKGFGLRHCTKTQILKAGYVFAVKHTKIKLSELAV
jgi:hypothetical protein